MELGLQLHFPQEKDLQVDPSNPSCAVPILDDPNESTAVLDTTDISVAFDDGSVVDEAADWLVPLSRKSLVVWGFDCFRFDKCNVWDKSVSLRLF
jgi:hypothetical protein